MQAIYVRRTRALNIQSLETCLKPVLFSVVHNTEEENEKIVQVVKCLNFVLCLSYSNGLQQQVNIFGATKNNPSPIFYLVSSGEETSF